ncbi:MAG: DUF4438 domain-containing protein [Clostridia bacterium]
MSNATKQPTSLLDLTTNKDKLVMQSVIGVVHSPTVRGTSLKVSFEGVPFTLPSVGGICYNVSIGDSVYGLAGDHIEPGVSIQNPLAEENLALNFLSCIGNVAVVMSGEAKGDKGYVTGTHGGIEHTLVWFNLDTLDKLCIGDKIQIRSYGQGLQLKNYEDIKIMNIDPNLFEKLSINPSEQGIVVAVTAIVPAYLMGSGIGSQAQSGDYDIMTADKQKLAELDLQDLKFGDIVYLQDCDNYYGRGYLGSACSIGVIVHSDCLLSGHGPGVTTIMTCRTNKIIPIIDKTANIGKYLDILKKV